MPSNSQPQIGGKVRRLRRQRQISQAGLAAAIGISASYLNLIEHNRRQITVPLLLKLAGYFGIEAGELAQSDDSQLSGDLMEIFGDDIFADTDITNQDIYDLASSNPAIARAVLLLFDKYQGHNGEKDKSGSNSQNNNSPHHLATDAISDFIQENANYFPSLEDAAKRVRSDIDNASSDFETGLKTYLRNVFGLDWRTISLPTGVASRQQANSYVFETSNILPIETSLFFASRHAGMQAAKNEIRDIINSSTLPLSSQDSPEQNSTPDNSFAKENYITNTQNPASDAYSLAQNILASYFAAALIMPYEPFLKACFDLRYDVERISRLFNASFEQVCQRMTSLQRPSAPGISLHLVRTDIAGNISKRFSLSGIHIPRHSGACPRWNVYSAFLQPGRTNIQLSQMPGGEIYFCIARSFEKGAFSHNAQRRHFSIGIGCHISHADRMIYSDGIDLGNISQIVPIGVGCRICPRMACEQRVQPPADHRFKINQSEHPESLYGRL